MHIMTSPYFTERHILKEKHKYLTHRFNITQRVYYLFISKFYIYFQASSTKSKYCLYSICLLFSKVGHLFTILRIESRSFPDISRLIYIYDRQ